MKVGRENDFSARNAGACLMSQLNLANAAQVRQFAATPMLTVPALHRVMSGQEGEPVALRLGEPPEPGEANGGANGRAEARSTCGGGWGWGEGWGCEESRDIGCDDDSSPTKEEGDGVCKEGDGALVALSR